MSFIVKFGRAALAVAVFWLVIAGILALQLWPSVPHTAKGWLAFIAFGPPLYLLGEALFEWLRPRRPGRALSAHSSSGLRIFIGVIAGTFVLVAGATISIQFGWQ